MSKAQTEHRKPSEIMFDIIKAKQDIEDGLKALLSCTAEVVDAAQRESQMAQVWKDKCRALEKVKKRK